MGEGERTSVWRARWGGGGSQRKSGGGADRHRAASMVAEETDIESVTPAGGDLEFWDERNNTEGGLLFIVSRILATVLN
jgi:hypothetical protein